MATISLHSKSSSQGTSILTLLSISTVSMVKKGIASFFFYDFPLGVFQDFSCLIFQKLADQNCIELNILKTGRLRCKFLNDRFSFRSLNCCLRTCFISAFLTWFLFSDVISNKVKSFRSMQNSVRWRSGKFARDLWGKNIWNPWFKATDAI